jgi:Protein of unknown function (DUF4232)
MNLDELENLIRAELRADAAKTPSGAGVRTAVLDAVAGEVPADRPARRWAVPLLVAAAVVALAVAATLVPRTFNRHSQPAKPRPTPVVPLPAAPAPVGMPACARGQQLVDGLGARFTDVGGKIGYAYEYYCAGPDGSRTGSVIEWFRMVDGRLAYRGSLAYAVADLYVMSMRGADGGVLVRGYDASPGPAGHPHGAVVDLTLLVDVDSSVSGAGEPVAQPCLAADLTLQWTEANEPTPHQVLRLTNQGSKACAVWGNPRYTPISTHRHVGVRYVVRGPAGGLGGEPAPPALLLQPGRSAYAAIGYDPMTTPCYDYSVHIVLANGVDLGTRDSAGCGDLVSYPLVSADNGSEDHPETEAPVTAGGSCLDATELVISAGDVRRSGSRAAMVVGLSASATGSCTISGYPNVRALDKGGNLLLIAQQSLRGPLGGLAAPGISEVAVVAPGRTASALVEWSSVGSRCFADGHISFTLGGSTATFGQSTERFCDLQVHPFVAGSTGSD